MSEPDLPFQLAGITVDPQNDQLSCGEQTVTVQSMAMKVLCYFAANPTQVISRDCLREHVWQNSTASNHTINNHVYSLRRSLAQLDAETRFIHTVTGSNGNGYRLVAPVTFPTQAPVDKKPQNTQPTTEPAAKHWLAAVPVMALVAFLIYGWLYPLEYNRSSPLTFAQGREQSPAISQDGAFLLYSHRPNRQASWELYARKLTGYGQPVKVFATQGHDDNFVSISPNSAKLAFNRLVRGQEGIYVADFDARSLTGSTARRIIALDRNNLSPAISWLDNERFFYTAKEAAKAPLRIYLHDLTQAKSEQVSSPPLNIFGDFAIMLSPDKRKLAVMRAEGYMGFRLYLYDVANKSLVATRVNGKEQRLNISFSDDGRQIYFIDEAGLLSAYDIETESITALSSKPYLGYWPLKVPGKAQFIFQQDWGLSSLTTQILRYNNPRTGGDGKSSLLVNNGLSIRAIEGVAEGGLIFAAIKPNFHIELWRYQDNKAYKLDQFHEKPEYRYPLSLDWQADSNLALLSINDSCRLVNIDNGRDSPLCPADQSVYGGSFGYQGNSIHLAGERNGNAVAIAMGSTGYPYEPLKALPGASIVKQGGDDQYYYRAEPGFDIHHFDAASGKNTLLIPRTYLNHGYSSNDFAVVEQGIYFMDKKPGKRNAVYFYRFEDGDISHVIDSPNEYPNIALSDDEQLIYQIQSIDNDSQLRLIEQTR